MHGYTQAILKRVMDSSQIPEQRKLDFGERFARFCFEKAPSCKCGCGEKTNPNTNKGGCIATKIRRFSESGESPDFLDYIGKHYEYKVSANYEPTDDEHQYILASIIGDGSLSRPYKGCNARIQWNMGNKDHAKFKLDKFEFIGSSFLEKQNPGFGTDWFCVSTSSHPLFSRYADKYGERKKNITKNTKIYGELNEIGWAWLYGDDGHISKSQSIAYIHTECVDYEGVVEICKHLDNFIGFKSASVHSYVGGAKKRKMHCIRMSKSGTKEFISRVKEHMANGMEYKTIID